jgi:NAD(P)-dependent dehydrogenase (short-subunit alcohol dehydrogenase family)
VAGTILCAREAVRRMSRRHGGRGGVIVNISSAAARLAPTIPMGRGGTADEVAEAVLWLLSPAASYTTGAILDVTGGR